MKPRLVLQIGWRLLLAMSLAASPWSSALSSAIAAAAQDAAQGELPCHDDESGAGESTPAGTDGCEDGCCVPANCGPASCVPHTSCAVVSVAQQIDGAVAREPESGWLAPAPPHPPPGEALRPPIR